MWVIENTQTYDFGQYWLKMKVWVWVSDTYEVLIKHLHMWSMIIPPPTSPVIPFSFDFPLEPMNLDVDVLGGVVDLTGANEDQ